MIKVYIIDDHKVLIDSFTDYFKNIENIEVIGYSLSGNNAIDFFNNITKEEIPDVVLQDVGLNDMSGIECTKAILKIIPSLKIIGFSSYMETSIVKKMFKTGAKGYLSKATDINQLEEAIHKVYAGETFVGSQISSSFLSDIQNTKKQKNHITPGITKREKEVLLLIIDEHSTIEIAEKLFISTNTVQTHRKSLILKFDVKNSVGLARKAIEFGIV